MYDGLNYLLDLDAVTALLVSVRDVLAPGGVAIIDQSTPANSENHADGFDDAGETPPDGGENARLNLWLMNGSAPTDGRNLEVVIDRFEFAPLL